MGSKRKVLLALTISQRAYYRGIVRYAREHDWHLVMDMVYTGRVPIGWHGDGILTILGYRRDLTDFILSSGVPTVAITLVNDKVPLPRVEGDNVEIGRLAAGHFLERGYRHFAWAPFLNDLMDAERYKGFSLALKQSGFECHVLPPAHSLNRRVWHENWAIRRGRLIAQLSQLPKPTAVFAYNDCVAADVIDACRDARLLVPEQVAVLGVDNDPDICDCAPVALSSVHHDLEGLAYEGARMLDRIMCGGRTPRKVVRVRPQGVVTRVSTDIHAVENVKVAIALRYVSENYPNHLLSIDEVSTAAKVSRRQLERDFKRAMGCTLNQYIVRKRLEFVKRQLQETEEKIVEISHRAGFTRPSHLFRVFRSCLRTSPSQFRKKHQAK